MNRFRAILNGQIKRNQMAGNAVARLKRMPSIRGKLVKQQWPLEKIQDLGGCRAIVPTIRDAQTLIEKMRGLNRHVLHRENPYIEEPKANGYRCHHMIYRYRGDGDDAVFMIAASRCRSAHGCSTPGRLLSRRSAPSEAKT
jgi:ppGpp synthetase/RelA/SpoT-type nucleotidyltranferase